MKLTFSAPITASDAESRIVAGQIVPFEKPGNTSAGTVVFASGALGDLEKPIILNLEHDQSRPVGKSIELSVTPGGIYAKFKVAETTAGNDLLIEAAEGLRTGFSIEATVSKHTMKGNTMYVTAADLTACAAVTRPAYGDNAQITEVAASEPDDAETITPSTEGSDMTDMVTSVEETAPAVEASAAPVVQAAAPIYTSPRFAGMTSSEYLTASMKAATGDSDSAILVKAANDSITTNTGLTLPSHMQSFITSTFAGRVSVAACGGSRPLPDSGMSFTIPRMGTAPTVTAPGEAGTVSATGMTSDYITVTVARYAGMNTMSFELLERSAPAFGDLLLAELRKGYEKATDKAVIAALTSGGTAASTQAGTVAGLQAFIAKEAPAAYDATGGEFATELIADSEWWAALLAANDGSSRPLFNALQPQNAAGQSGIASARGSVFGANLWVDPHIATSGLIDESAFLVSPDSVGIWESPTTQLRVNVLTSGEVEVSLHGYLAVTVLKAGGVRRFNLT